MLIATGKKVRYAAITATAPQPCSGPGSFGLTQITTIGAIARIGIVWLPTMYGMKPRCSTRHCASSDAEREADDRADREADHAPPSP